MPFLARIMTFHKDVIQTQNRPIETTARWKTRHSSVRREGAPGPAHPVRLPRVDQSEGLHAPDASEERQRVEIAAQNYSRRIFRGPSSRPGRRRRRPERVHEPRELPRLLVLLPAPVAAQVGVDDPYLRPVREGDEHRQRVPERLAPESVVRVRPDVEHRVLRQRRDSEPSPAPSRVAVVVGGVAVHLAVPARGDAADRRREEAVLEGEDVGDFSGLVRRVDGRPDTSPLWGAIGLDFLKADDVGILAREDTSDAIDRVF